MAEVTPDDVFLSVWRSTDPTTIALLPPGAPDPNDPQNTLLSGAAWLTAPEIFALATVKLRGIPGEDVGFWRFGFIQLKFITNDWAHYRGDIEADGSVFVAMDRPPARPQQLCRDSLAKEGIGGAFERFPFVGPVIFYDPETPVSGFLNRRVAGFLPMGAKIPAGGAMLFTIQFSDKPQRFYDLVKVNNAAQRLNNLYSLQNGAAYVTMFAVQKGPNKPIVVKKSFQWNVRWRAHFGRNAGLTVQLPPRAGDVMDMNISSVVKGPPQDERFKNSILDTKLPNCNTVLRAAHANPVVRESKRWEDWKVTH